MSGMRQFSVDETPQCARISLVRRPSRRGADRPLWLGVWLFSARMSRAEFSPVGASLRRTVAVGTIGTEAVVSP